MAKRLKEPLFYSEVRETQGCAANIQSLKRLNIEEKRKSHYVFRLKKNVRDEFFRVFLERSDAIGQGSMKSWLSRVPRRRYGLPPVTMSPA